MQSRTSFLETAELNKRRRKKKKKTKNKTKDGWEIEEMIDGNVSYLEEILTQ